MSIVKMKRLKVMALAEERDNLLSGLLHLGCVEISDPEDRLSDPDWSALLSRDTSKMGQVKAKATQLTNALDALKKYAPEKTGLFRIRDVISESDFFSEEKETSALKNAEEINNSVAEIARCDAEDARLNVQFASLTPWESLSLPLETSSTANVEILLGTLPVTSPLDTVRGVLAEAAPLCELLPVSADKEQQYVVLLCHKAEWDAAQEALKPYTFSVSRFKELTGTAAENMGAIEAQLEVNASAREKAQNDIRAHAALRSLMQVVSDRLVQDAAKEAVRERALTDGTIVFWEGWVPVPKLDKVTRLLDGFDAAYSFRDPLEGDDVPTLLDNPKWMRSINMVTEMYSPPAYDGIDPNPFMFGWYVFFFGFMFADLAYGIIIWLVSTIIIKKTKPKGHIFYLGQWLGASTAFCGLFVGGFFGDAITTFSSTFLGISVEQMPAWLAAFCNGLIVNPVNDPMKVLIIALGIGCVQLFMGQCIHIYMEARDGHILEGLLDVVPWWMFLGGIPVMMLAGSKALLLAGVVALVCTQGRHADSLFGKIFGGVASLYDVTSWLSDILSYARLMALMLATSVIAMVFNTLAAMPKMLIVFIVIFAIGHIFNIGVNLIGTYVHAARLQYLEYYGKFYKDGGRFFKPLRYNTKFVDIDEEEN